MKFVNVDTDKLDITIYLYILDLDLVNTESD